MSSVPNLESNEEETFGILKDKNVKVYTNRICRNLKLFASVIKSNIVEDILVNIP